MLEYLGSRDFRLIVFGMFLGMGFSLLMLGAVTAALIELVFALVYYLWMINGKDKESSGLE
jgi:hypothetical protein